MPGPQIFNDMQLAARKLHQSVYADFDNFKENKYNEYKNDPGVKIITKDSFRKILNAIVNLKLTSHAGIQLIEASKIVLFFSNVMRNICIEQKNKKEILSNTSPINKKTIFEKIKKKVNVGMSMIKRKSTISPKQSPKQSPKPSPTESPKESIYPRIPTPPSKPGWDRPTDREPIFHPLNTEHGRRALERMTGRGCGKKLKKQKIYTKKNKIKINGTTKVIYSKEKTRKLYVKSKNRMINLKKYKKLNKKV